MFSEKGKLQSPVCRLSRVPLIAIVLLITLLPSLYLYAATNLITDSLFTRKNYWNPWNDTTTTGMKFVCNDSGCSITILKPGQYEYEGGLQKRIPILKEKSYHITLIASSDSSCSLPLGFKEDPPPYLRYAIRMINLKPQLDTFKLTWVNSGNNAIDPDDATIGISIGNARGILHFKKLTVVEQDVSASDINDFECPVTPKLNPPLRPSSELPSGLLAYSFSGAGTIYLSPINKWNPVGIPNINASPSNIFFSDDGKWLLYQVDKEIYFIRIDGKFKTKVPLTDTITTCNFYRKSPFGTEIIHYVKNARTLKAILVSFSDDGVTIGCSRTIADLGNNYAFENYYQISVVKDQIWGAICPFVNDSTVKRSGFMTIPDSGKGIATPSNIYKFSDDNKEQVFGCSHTMSFDGQYCVANPGHAAETGDFSHCAPFQHKGFYVSRFYRDTDSAVGTREHVHRYSYSLNWCPDKYLPWEWTAVDFNLYNFTNNNKILVAAQCGDSSTRQGLWAIDWQTNYWYPLNPDSIAIKASGLAGYIGSFDQSILDSLAKWNTSFSDTSVKNPIGYKIVRPYGKEVYYPGERCTIQVYSKEEGNASVKIQFGKYVFNILNTAINPKKDSIISYVIPPYFLKSNKIGGIAVLDTIRPDSAECRIRIEHYTPGICDPILSQPFSIHFRLSINKRPVVGNERVTTMVRTVDLQGIRSIFKTKKVYSFALFDLLGRPVFSWDRSSEMSSPQMALRSLNLATTIYIARYSCYIDKKRH